VPFGQTRPDPAGALTRVRSSAARPRRGAPSARSPEARAVSKSGVLKDTSRRARAGFGSDPAAAGRAVLGSCDRFAVKRPSAVSDSVSRVAPQSARHASGRMRSRRRSRSRPQGSPYPGSSPQKRHPPRQTCSPETDAGAQRRLQWPTAPGAPVWRGPSIVGPRAPEDVGSASASRACLNSFRQPRWTTIRGSTVARTVTSALGAALRPAIDRAHVMKNEANTVTH